MNGIYFRDDGTLCVKGCTILSSWWQRILQRLGIRRPVIEVLSLGHCRISGNVIGD